MRAAALPNPGSVRGKLAMNGGTFGSAPTPTLPVFGGGIVSGVGAFGYSAGRPARTHSRYHWMTFSLVEVYSASLRAVPGMSGSA